MNKKKLKNTYFKRSYKGILRKIIWIGFCCIFAMGIIGIVRTANLENMVEQIVTGTTESWNHEIESLEKKVESMIKENMTNEEGAKLYACNFLSDFYTWNEGEEKAEERIERLKPYLAEGMEPDAGYDVSRLSMSSKVVGCDVWEVKTVENTVKVTAKVKYLLTSQTELEGEKPKKAVKQEEKYVTVSLATDGERFRVMDNPHIIQRPADYVYTLESNQSADANSLITDDAIQKEIIDFMATYFKMATTATTEELNYYSTAETESMLGLYEFVKMDDISIYETKEGYQVFTQIRLQDSSTKAEVLLQPECELKKEKDRYVVTIMKF